MTFIFQPMTREHAQNIMRWRYQTPYDFYNFDNDDEVLMELLSGEYYSVSQDQDQDQDPSLIIGFFCIGNTARVPGGYAAGIYVDDSFMDIGLGLAPSRTGIGMGKAFVQEGMDYLRHQFDQSKFRLVVASFNQRAIQVYRDNGFVEHGLVISSVQGQDVEFLCMIAEN
ncbi:GNAT family N-acetyltransferase [Paenibacillus guangzhouensis]|uniref:GNAT family N-acetyltransferase n=1 Tax=Paenibacillus guangzhouensis TaxID=1473112 RepID=UPI00187B5ABB|nr:GNAT family protein [Paenibacillus guangzhouensis]